MFNRAIILSSYLYLFKTSVAEKIIIDLIIFYNFSFITKWTKWMHQIPCFGFIYKIIYDKIYILKSTYNNLGDKFHRKT